MLVLAVWFMSWMFAGSVWLPNNTSLSYPIQQVSTIDCRTEYWEEMQPWCKINLPKINGANYETYKDSTVHKQIYTVLRAAPYKDSRNQNIWAHAGVDIATARGTPLFSIWEGEVTYAGRQNWYGNVVKIKYLFQGKYIHAIYAHMDTIETEAGKKVSAWQRIWTVGNSGTTFWALWWFHVHFEINKDNGWRPMYAYLSCPDLSKGHMTIIQEWLCREQLLANQYDPIVLFEQNRLWNVIQDKPTQDIQDPSTINENTETVVDDTIVDEKEIVEEKEEAKSDTKVESEEIHNSPKAEETNKSNPDIVVKEEIITNKESIAEEKPIETITEQPKIEEEKDTPISYQSEYNTGRIGEKITIDIDSEWLSDETIHFLSTHELYINNHTWTNILWIGEKQIIEINFYPKWSDNKFVGILPFSLDIIPSQTNIVTDYSSIKLISTNPTNITIQGQSPWASVLIISIENLSITKIPYTIK